MQERGAPPNGTNSRATARSVDATADCDVRVDPPKVKVTAPRGGAFERKFRKPPKKKKKQDDAEL